MGAALQQPAIRVAYSTKGKVVDTEFIVLEKGQRVQARLGGQAYEIERLPSVDNQSSTFVLADPSGRRLTLVKGDTVQVSGKPGDGVAVSSYVDFVKPDSGPVTRYFGWSALVHVALMVAISVLVRFAPNDPPPPPKTDVNAARVKNILAKMKEKVPEPKAEIKPKPQPIAVRKAEPPKPVPEPKARPAKPIPRPQPAKAVAQAAAPRPVSKPAGGPPPPPGPAVAAKSVNTVARASAGVQASNAASAQVRQAKVASALSFLGGPSTGANPVFNMNQASSGGKQVGKYDAVGATGVGGPATGKKSYLASLAGKPGDASGPIGTKGARNVATGSAFGNGDAKGLNDVQGKVSGARLAGAGSAGGALTAGGGMQMGGQGKIDRAAVEAAIARHLHKLQFCYEKALLTRPTISGKLTMGWVISPGGRAGSVAVVQSQLNDPKLHDCIAAEIAKITFPSPQGGSVEIKHPFSFSASAL